MQNKRVASEATLLIRTGSQPQASVEWVIHDGSQHGEVQRLPREQLSELAAHPAARRTHVLIPVEKTLCRTLQIPDENYELTDRKLHWLADETLDENAPSLHWTLLFRAGTTLAVAGIDKAWLEAELNTLSSCGLTVTKATLDALCLPAAEDGWTVLKDGDAWLLRTQNGNVSRLTETWLVHLLTRFPPQQLTSYGVLPIPHPNATEKPECHIMSLYRDADATTLLHGNLRPPAAVSAWSARLKLVAAYGVALAVSVALLVQAACYWRLDATQAQLKDTLTHQWQRYIPENRHSNNLRTYLPKQLQQRSSAPLTVMLRLQASLARVPGIALEGMRYNSQQKSLQLFLFARDEGQIQQFIKENTLGFALTVDRHEQGMWIIKND
ncbi:hypothetical protein ABFP30_004102 [Enterobacter bugandensis]